MNFVEFVRESNRIEGIQRHPTQEEIEATVDFVKLKILTVSDFEKLVSIYAPGHKLRLSSELNVQVGSHIAPRGGIQILTSLQRIIGCASSGDHPWFVHLAYENLHPFTDGNGRSGRTLWLWQMKEAPLGFLHHFYYQTLEMQDARLK